MELTENELAFLRTQRLGRLATVDAGGAPQNNPVGFFYNAGTGTFDIGGFALGSTRKFRNVQRNPNVALVIDELTSTDPWRVRGMEIRGEAEALTGQRPPRPGMSPELIRIRPRRIYTWGIEPGASGMVRRVADRAA
ncbi:MULTISPECIES: PPOX class F420-dependent oxidoreductase [Thermomonospora]|uniref:Pyridoxamine 5'-phosphate oxidase family protein n=1 Tax=Thermomonospora cellulosilytica TaxID=1411118 RepID=A0A7W3N2J8_9ACTN|nr:MULTISPECIES: PPOX class F420-dependent oxidoreductase [Thermomonospora]MBA9006384.1 pyridoxamine 5'-phosphate oxidase family protein [Thermomonospora cellulosilytica]